MKYCPKCQANVEGLIYRCDCCGASLEEKKKKLFICGIYELPQCFDFATLIYEMIELLQPVFVKIKCEQKGPEKVGTFST